jgi:RND family efflux transporter MFP subunit
LPWYQQAMITTLVPGRIARVSALPGEAVEAGRELAFVESLELEDLQRDLLRADTERELAARFLRQREELAEKDAISRVDLQQTRHVLDEATADVAIAIQKLLALGLDREAIERLRETREPLAGLPITSPIGGVVTHADVRVGQVVATDEHLFHIVDASEVSIVAEILESDVAAVEAGQPIRATFPALPGVTVEGHIDHVHPAIDPGTRTREAVAHVPNPGGLRPGLSGRVEVEVERVEQAIVCPDRALIDAPGGPFVLLRRGEGTFERRRVEIGLRDGDRVEIRDGLFPGDQVVVVGRQLLAAMFHQDAGGAGAASPGRVLAGSDATATAGREDGVIVARATVELPTRAKSFVGPRIEGRIATIRVEPGEHVEAGQVLAEVDSLGLRNLQLDLLRTRLELEWTRAAVDRLARLVPQGASPRRDLWQSESDLEVLETTQAALQSKLRAVGLPEEVLDRLMRAGLNEAGDEGLIAATLPLRAPAAGRVAHFDAVPGQVVRPSAAVFEVHDTDRVWVRGFVFESGAAGVHPGQSARLSFPALPGREAIGAVIRVAPTLEHAERVLPVWVEVENPDGLLVEGMLARAVLSPAKADSGVARLDDPAEPPLAADALRE